MINVMKHYIGTKLINAIPMNRLDYNKLRGWQIPSDENPSDEGYLVEYLDGGISNTDIFKGYISWSPKEVFEKSYRETNNLTFSEALEALKIGKKVSRKGWNGKNMFIFLVPGSTFKVNRAPLLGIYPEGTEINYLSHIDMKTANNKIVPWLASQTDLIEEDWGILDD